jgi:hypothetical protein
MLEKCVAENQNVRYGGFHDRPGSRSAFCPDGPGVADINGLGAANFPREAAKIILPLKVRNPLKSLDSDERIQENPSKREPQIQGKYR